MERVLGLRLGIFLFGLAFPVMIFSSGCSSTATSSTAIAGGTLGLGTTPSHQLEQVYYLGVFDPQEQLPPTIYRVIVRGQASALGATNFASGWVPAALVDSLNSRVGFKKDGSNVNLSSGEPLKKPLKTGRRLMLFGPEGFREAPADHRLVLVMGSNPEAYFNSINNALGAVSKVRVDQLNGDLRQKLMDALRKLKDERERLKDLQADYKVNLADQGGN